MLFESLVGIKIEIESRLYCIFLNIKISFYDNHRNNRLCLISTTKSYCSPSIIKQENSNSNRLKYARANFKEKKCR